MKKIEFTAKIIVFVTILWSGICAGDFSVDTDRFKTNPFYDGYLSVYGGAGLDAGLLDINFIMKYQPETLVTLDADGNILRKVIDNQFMSDLSIAYSPFKWLDIGFVLPVFIYQNGDGWDDDDSLPSGGIGDIRLVPRFQLVNLNNGMFAVSVITEVSAPTGKLVYEALGSSKFTFKPAIALGTESKWVGFAANFFYQVLEKQRYARSVFDDEFGAKAAVNIHAIPDLLDVSGEFISSTSISDPFDNEAVDNIELGGGVRVKTPVDLDVTAGAYGEIGSAVGVPKYRILLGVSWNMNVHKRNGKAKAEEKAESPKIVNSKPESKPEPKVEQKPEPKPEPKVEEPKVEPKPEPKVEPKVEPKIEPKPEPKPEPKVKEPKPEPKVKEPKPEPKPEPKKVVKTGDKLQSIVRFQKGTDYIDDTIEIEKVAMLLSRNYTLKVRIEAHNDMTENSELSKKRAEAVKAVLIKNGVEPGRIFIKVIGSSEPVSTGDTDIDLEKNRRVEFYIVQ